MNIKDKLVYATSKWRLTNITEIYANSVKAVYRANAASWGGVIVKINNNVDELCHEAAMLKALNGNGCCRLYAFEEEQGILVEGQLCPGTVLREELDVQKRVENFAAVFEKLHESTANGAAECALSRSGKKGFIMGESGKLEFEAYLDWLANAKRFCEESIVNSSVEVRELLKETGLTEKMQYAYEIGAELFTKYPERILLHGDLHHDNILTNAEGGYSAIDPKGVIGPRIFDVPRFVLNEIGYVEELCAEEIKGHLEMVIRLMSERLGYPVQDIRKLLFMETILASVWSVEDGEEIDEMQIQIVKELGR